MKSLSELQNNMFLHHFRKKTLQLNQTIIKETSSDEDRLDIRLKLFSMIESFPVYVLEKVHPEHVFLYLEKARDDEGYEALDELLQARSRCVNARNWNCFIRQNIVTISNRGLLKKMVSHFPIMTDWYRFPLLEWRYLPFMNWEKIVLLENLFRQNIGNYSSGIFLRKEWSQLPKNIQKICMTWLRLKMPYEMFRGFKSFLSAQDIQICEQITRKGYQFLQSVMQGSVMS